MFLKLTYFTDNQLEVVNKFRKKNLPKSYKSMPLSLAC